MKNKCVFVVGPESSGSMLVARICSHVLDIQSYGEWNGVAWSARQGGNKVCHRSLPYNIPPTFPNVKKWVSDNKKDYEIYFVLTTRDITISEFARVERFPKNMEQVQIESARAREIMIQIMHSGYKYYIWSYETFLFLGKEYLNLLYQFLGVESDFVPQLVDGNRKRLLGGR